MRILDPKNYVYLSLLKLEKPYFWPKLLQNLKKDFYPKIISVNSKSLCYYNFTQKNKNNNNKKLWALIFHETSKTLICLFFFYPKSPKKFKTKFLNSSGFATFSVRWHPISMEKRAGGSDKKLYKNRQTDGGYLIGSRQFEISTYLRGGGGNFQNWFCREDWVGKSA